MTSWSKVWKSTSIAKVVISTWNLHFSAHIQRVMACIFKTIAATQFLLMMLVIYFLMNCNMLKLQTCCSIYKRVMGIML